MLADTILIIYIRLQQRQSNQSNQNDRKRTENKYPLEQNEYESDNENGCQNLFFDGNKWRRRSHLKKTFYTIVACHTFSRIVQEVKKPTIYDIRF